MRIHTTQVQNHIGQKVKLGGFIQAIRDQGNIKFIILRDLRLLINLLLCIVTIIFFLNIVFNIINTIYIFDDCKSCM